MKNLWVSFIGVFIALALYGADWIGQNGYGQLAAKILLLLIGVALIVFGVVVIIAFVQHRSRIMRNR